MRLPALLQVALAVLAPLALAALALVYAIVARVVWTSAG
jgi:hypothetical protein